MSYSDTESLDYFIAEAETFCAYCAGFLDGEGSVQIFRKRDMKRGGRQYYALRVNIYNTNRVVLEAIQRRYRGQIKSNDKRYVKTLHVLCIVSRQAYKFLKDIQQYSIVKKARIDNAIAFYEYQRKVGLRSAGWGKGRVPLSPENLAKYEEFRQGSLAMNQRGTKSK